MATTRKGPVARSRRERRSPERLPPLAAALALLPAAIFWLAVLFPRQAAILQGHDPPESGGARVGWERDVWMYSLILLAVCVAFSLLASIYSHARGGHLAITLAAASPAAFFAVYMPFGLQGLFVGLTVGTIAGLSLAGIITARKRRGG